MRAEVAGPLAVQAERDGAAYLAAVHAEAVASARLATVGRFGRRKARTEHQAAREQAQTQRAQVRAVGGEPPRTPEALPAWAAQAAAVRAETDPRAIDADRAVETARADQKATRQRHQHERRALLVREFGAEQARRDQYGMRTINSHRNAHDAGTRAAEVRAEADELRSLPVGDAARQIEAKRAEQERQRQGVAERERQLRDPFERDPHRHGGSGHEGPTRSL